MQTTDLFDAALALPFKTRLELANRLWESLKPPGVMSEDDPGFAAEILRRVEDDIEESIDAEEALRRLWEAQRRRESQRQAPQTGRGQSL